MSQPSVASYFHSRKRAAGDEIFNAKNKVILVDPKTDNSTNVIPKANKILEVVNVPSVVQQHQQHTADQSISLDVSKPTIEVTVPEPSSRGRKTPNPSGKPVRRCLKRAANTDASTTVAASQPKIVKFTLAGNLSPKKKAVTTRGSRSGDAEKSLASVTAVLFGTKDYIGNIDRGMKTPTKEEQLARIHAEKLNTARKNLSMDEIKSKVTKSTRLQDLKASMSKLQALEESRQKIISGNKTLKNIRSDKHSYNAQQSDRAANILSKSLKPFETIDLDVLSSPQKGLTTPTKLVRPSSPAAAGHEDVLMSPKKTATPRRIFSPSKAASPNKSAAVPAYQRFQSLAETGRAALQMPYKYRCLAETFKCLDTVCSMFFNRRETITMKKLKPAVQRMLRRNFTETSLAQIKFLYPDAYKFAQKKMLNAGSHTKFDYYQLVITPNVQAKCETTLSAGKLNEDDIIRSGQEQTMNPQIMIARQQTFNNLLLNVVKDEHDKFLRSLDPPMIIPKEKINRWHAEFDLHNCPDIGAAELPQPPNVDKFSSAKDILSTARNLFNCATPMERIMQRFEAATGKQPHIRSARSECTDTESEPSTPTTIISAKDVESAQNPVSAILKDVPKSLLERIRAKQAAKALDAMTRRPSQDKEAGRYERLPELARHLRNIFVTESKSVLELDTVLAKIENSFRERMPKDSLKELLQLIAKEAPNNWLSFHFIRKTDFVKIKKDADLNEIIRHLELKATDKAR